MMEPIGPQNLEDDDLENVVQAYFVSLTGLDPTLVRPSWQQDPPAMPDRNVNWLAFHRGLARRTVDPVVRHTSVDDPEAGQSSVSRQEEQEWEFVCYGPNAGRCYNRISLTAGVDFHIGNNTLRLVRVGNPQPMFEKKHDQWINRVGSQVVLRRTVSSAYTVPDVITAGVILYTEELPPESIDVDGADN